MPIEEPLYTGQRIYLHGKRYYIALNGTSLYLYTTEKAAKARSKTCAATALRATVLDHGSLTPPPSPPPPPKPPKHTTSKPASSASTTDDDDDDVPPTTTPPISTRQRYVYAVRNCDLPRATRELKIGVTHSIPQRLRTYQQRNPNDQAVVTVQCTDQGAARALESALHQHFDEFRVDRSEVFEIRVHEVHRQLKTLDYTLHVDNIWRKKKASQK